MSYSQVSHKERKMYHVMMGTRCLHVVRKRDSVPENSTHNDISSRKIQVSNLGENGLLNNYADNRKEIYKGFSTWCK